MRHWRLTASIVGLLVLAGLGTGLAVGLSGSTGNPVEASAGLSTPQQLRLEKGITAPTVASEAEIVAKEVRSQFMTHGKLLLPHGSRLSISNATFHSLSAEIAQIDAVVTGPDPGRWQLVLVREAGQWLLIGTRKLS